MKLYVHKSYKLFRTAKVTDFDLVSKRINLGKETERDINKESNKRRRENTRVES